MSRAAEYYSTHGSAVWPGSRFPVTRGARTCDWRGTGGALHMPPNTWACPRAVPAPRRPICSLQAYAIQCRPAQNNLLVGRLKRGQSCLIQSAYLHDLSQSLCTRQREQVAHGQRACHAKKTLLRQVIQGSHHKEHLAYFSTGFAGEGSEGVSLKEFHKLEGAPHTLYAGSCGSISVCRAWPSAGRVQVLGQPRSPHHQTQLASLGASRCAA